MESDSARDEEIIRLVQNGDILAFGIIVKRYQNKLYYFVNRILKDEDESMDAVQDTFIKIYKSLDRIKINLKFSTYAFEIAKNTAFSVLRKKRHAVQLNESIAGDGDYYDEFIRNETGKEVRLALRKLKPEEERVLRLYYFKELSYERIGKLLGLPLNTVRTKLRRAKEALRKIINEKD